MSPGGFEFKHTFLMVAQLPGILDELTTKTEGELGFSRHSVVCIKSCIYVEQASASAGVDELRVLKNTYDRLRREVATTDSRSDAQT